MRRESDMAAWALFCRCAELGSIRRACEERSEDPSAASRQLRSLERSVGTALFDRTRKPATLTSAGARAFRAMAPVLEAYERAISAIREDPREAGGPIMIASPAGFGAEVLPGLFMEFQAENSGIELVWTEISADLIREAVAGSQGAPDLLCVYGQGLSLKGAASDRIGRMAFVPCASPLYTSRHGSPARPAECAEHSGVLIESEWRSSSGELLKGAEREKLRWKNALRFQNIPSILQAVKLGAGVSPDIPMIYALPEIRAGRLVPVMKGWHRPPLECLLVTNPRSGSLARVRTFRVWLLERLKEAFSGYEKALEAVLA